MSLPRKQKHWPSDRARQHRETETAKLTGDSSSGAGICPQEAISRDLRAQDSHELTANLLINLFNCIGQEDWRAAHNQLDASELCSRERRTEGICVLKAISQDLRAQGSLGLFASLLLDLANCITNHDWRGAHDQLDALELRSRKRRALAP
jgi:hypothetical protein